MENKKLKVLNLYAGIGGNRKLWTDVEVTAVEIDEEIAGIYKYNFPNDKIIIGDAHEYLLTHYKEFDFIWASPPCPTHSRLNFSRKDKSYPNMTLYQEILFLKSWFKGKWVIENVIPYYEPLIKPSVELGRHFFWSNFDIKLKKFTNIDVSRSTQEQLAKDLDMPIPRMCARLLLRNCLKPEIGQHILKEALKQEQSQLNTTDSIPPKPKVLGILPTII
jgi:DNA (cytosine-5)-methyltransferase 1